MGAVWARGVTRDGGAVGGGAVGDGWGGERRHGHVDVRGACPHRGELVRKEGVRRLDRHVVAQLLRFGAHLNCLVSRLVTCRLEDGGPADVDTDVVDGHARLGKVMVHVLVVMVVVVVVVVVVVW